MAWDVKVVADSVSPSGHRLTSVEACFPACVQQELLKHRAFSVGSASNRAIPNSTIIEQVRSDPFIPLSWPKRHKAMQPQEYVSDPEVIEMLRYAWAASSKVAISYAESLTENGVHKEIANRLLGPYQWVTVLITASDWDNFFALRCHEAAEQHMRKLAEMIRSAREGSSPRWLDYGEWHLPYIDGLDCAGGFDLALFKKLSVARSARVSTLTQGRRTTPLEDLYLFDRLKNANPMHSVPFEMVATPVDGRCANFEGWQSYRWELEH